MLKRTSQPHEDQWLALLELRNTPIQDLNTSPAEIVFGRSTRTVIRMRKKKCENFAFDRRSKRQNAIKCSYDKCGPTETLSPLHVHQNVYFQSPEKLSRNFPLVRMLFKPKMVIIIAETEFILDPICQNEYNTMILTCTTFYLALEIQIPT